MTPATPSSCPGPARWRATLAALALLLPGCFGDYGGGMESAAGGVVPGSSDPGGGSGTEGVDAFAQTAYPLLAANCATCHAGAGPGTPNIAHADLQTAYDAVVNFQKVNLAAPDTSRLVQRLLADFHNCWSDCVQDGMQMLAAIQQWAILVDFNGGGTNAGGDITSDAMAFSEGVEDTGGERYADNTIALFEFKEGQGAVARDTSGVPPAMDLELVGADWLSSYGIQIETGVARALPETSRKLYELIASTEIGTGQYSVEAWITPANVTQEGPARIVSYSRGTGARNFTLGQVLYNYDFRNRSMAEGINNNGTPSLQTYDGDQDLQATQQHVVITYDPYRGRRIYVNGAWTDDVDERMPGRLWNWSPNYSFVLGNETTEDRLWLGKIHLVAVYNQALTDAQIQQNFLAGVGKRLSFAFDVSQWAGPGTSVAFKVSELDDYSYLFCEPTYRGPNQSGLRVADMRVAVNGQVPVSGQAFRNVDVAVSGGGAQISRQCSVVPKDQGPGGDSFSIVFARLGGFENVEADPPPPPPPAPVLGDPLPEVGIRDFAKINETMGALTGVDPGDVRSTFEELAQQLPSGPDARSFVSAHQVGISKLALEYCDRLVEAPGLRSAFFGPGFDFGAAPDAWSGDPAQRDQLVRPLADRMLGVGLADQPDPAQTRQVLDALLVALTSGCTPGSCDAARTRTAAKATCAAMLSSAAVTVH